MSLSELQELMMDREAWRAVIRGTQTHVHQVGDAIPPSHPLSSPSPPALNLSQHQVFFPMSPLFALETILLVARSGKQEL